MPEAGSWNLPLPTRGGQRPAGGPNAVAGTFACFRVAQHVAPRPPLWRHDLRRSIVVVNIRATVDFLCHDEALSRREGTSDSENPISLHSCAGHAAAARVEQRVKRRPGVRGRVVDLAGLQRLQMT